MQNESLSAYSITITSYPSILGMVVFISLPVAVGAKKDIDYTIDPLDHRICTYQHPVPEAVGDYVHYNIIVPETILKGMSDQEFIDGLGFIE